MRCSVRWCNFVVALAVPFVAVASAWSQGQLGDKKGLEKAYFEHDARRRELFNGNARANPKDAKDAKIAEAAAQWFIYRATIKTEALKAQDDFNIAVRDILDKKNAEMKRPLIEMLGKECVHAMKAVLDRDIKSDPTTVIHACQMLPTMAKLKTDSVCAYLITLIEYPKTHDAVRLHALKAMREAMPVRIQLDTVIPDKQQNLEDFKDKDQNAKREHDVKNVNALTRYIERSVRSETLSLDELATLRFLRREAIASLAAAGAPAVTAHPKAPAGKQLDGMVAPTLLKVLARKGNIEPPFLLPEKIEAAVGLCLLEYPNMPEYNPDVAVYLVGQTVVEFIADYNKDFANFTLVGKGKQPPVIGFKSDAKRFEAALKKLEENAKGNAAAANSAKELKIKSKGLLDAVLAYGQTDSGRLEDLNRLVAQSLPKNNAVFKTLKNAPKIPLD